MSSCPFHNSNRIGPDCLREVDQGQNFVVDHPLPSEVYNTALNCVGVPFHLGLSGISERDNKNGGLWIRRKQKNQVCVPDIVNSFQGRRRIHPSYEPCGYSERPDVPLTSLLDKENITHQYSLKRKSQTQSVPVSMISLKFFYHFEKPQKTSPFIDGIDIHQDTRMEMRSSLPTAK